MIHYENRRSGEEEKVTYHEPEGIIAYVKELNAGKHRSMTPSILRV